MGLEKLLEETPEAYYWIGFLMADGYVDGKRNRIKLKLSIKDKSHLEIIAKFINVKIHMGIEKYTYKNKEYRKQMIYFETGNKFLVPQIIKKYGFYQKKTYHPPKINIKRDDLFLSFMIGYIDGDGFMGPKNSIGMNVHINWEKNLNVWFKRIWKLSGCKIFGNVKEPKCKNYKKNQAQIKISNTKFSNFLKDFYIVHNLPALKRKWDKIYLTNTHEDFLKSKEKTIKLWKQGNLTGKQISKLTGKTLDSVYRMKFLYV